MRDSQGILPLNTVQQARRAQCSALALTELPCWCTTETVIAADIQAVAGSESAWLTTAAAFVVRCSDFGVPCSSRC